jgi:hypothetical protein
MQYEEALKRWGATKLARDHRGEIVVDSVMVDMEFNEGYACCGGRDPDCYCSFAESPSANVKITGRDEFGKHVSETISHYEFDFVTILKEIVAAADGEVTA